jgi:anti-sigma factor RsiW
MSERTPLELELHSYVDGALDDEGMAAIERYLESEPQAAATVRDYLLQKAHIRAHADNATATRPSRAVEELTNRLARRLRPTRRWSFTRLALMPALLALGWIGHYAYAPLAADPAYTDEAIHAYLLAATVPLQPMPPSPERIGDLFMRIGERQNVPDLSELGLRPWAAQLVPTDEGFAVQLTYRGDNGELLSYFVLHDAHGEDEIAPHAVRRNGVTLVYWQHSHTQYAVAGPDTGNRLASIVRLIEPVSGI